jgi:hypothetical protein
MACQPKQAALLAANHSGVMASVWYLKAWLGRRGNDLLTN